MKLRLILVACALSAAPAVASAQAPAPAGDGGGTEQLTLPKGRLVLSGFFKASLSDGAVFKPFSISPDLWYGVNDDLTVGLVHSSAGLSGFLGEFSLAGDPLCLAGTENGCPKVYNSVAIDARYRLKFGSMLWAADGGLVIRSLDPFALSLKAGVLGRWSSGPLAVELQPALFVGVTERDAFGDSLSVPVSAIYTLNDKLAVSGQTGLVLPFQNTGDTYSVPLSIGAHYLATPELRLLAAFSLPRLIASGGGLDFRTLTIGGAYAF